MEDAGGGGLLCHFAQESKSDLRSGIFSFFSNQPMFCSLIGTHNN